MYLGLSKKIQEKHMVEKKVMHILMKIKHNKALSRNNKAWVQKIKHNKAHVL